MIKINMGGGLRFCINVKRIIRESSFWLRISRDINKEEAIKKYTKPLTRK
jgi:hypothetical protein